MTASVLFGTIGAYMNHVTALAATSKSVATLSLNGSGFSYTARMAERQRACALCRNRSSTMHMLPKNPELRMKWLQFIFGTMPQQDHSNLVICSAHFEERDFAKRLRLKPGAIPSRQSTASAQSGFPPENVLVKVVPGGCNHCVASRRVATTSPGGLDRRL